MDKYKREREREREREIGESIKNKDNIEKVEKTSSPL
jgi:hypothetical protein